MLAYDDVGSGPAVLLLHSGVCDRRMWHAQRDALSDGDFRVVAPDLPGFGDSPLPGGELSFAGAVAELLADMGIERAAVVGSSLGGRVALELATAAPATVSALALLCPAYRGLEPTADADAFEAEEERLLESGDVDGAVALNVKTWLGPDASPATRQLVAGMQRRAFDVQLAAEESDDPPRLAADPVDPAAVTCPVLVVSGGRDLEHFRSIGAHLASQLPHVRHVVLPWAAHLPSLERPSDVTSLLLRFLADPGAEVSGA